MFVFEKGYLNTCLFYSKRVCLHKADTLFNDSSILSKQYT